MFCLVTLAFDLFDLFKSLSLAKSYIYHFAIFALIDLMGSFGVARFNKKKYLEGPPMLIISFLAQVFNFSLESNVSIL